jgi:hypothetical protein
MELEVPDIFIQIADLKEGEQIIGINAQAGEECDLSDLAFAVHGCLGMDPNMISTTSIRVVRCGWIERPAPDTKEGVHDAPLGKLWVVYKDTTAHLSATKRFSQEFDEEQHRTQIALAGVRLLLSRDTFRSRRQLVALLRQRAQLIEAEIV